MPGMSSPEPFMFMPSMPLMSMPSIPSWLMDAGGTLRGALLLAGPDEPPQPARAVTVRQAAANAARVRRVGTGMAGPFIDGGVDAGIRQDGGRRRRRPAGSGGP